MIRAAIENSQVGTLLQAGGRQLRMALSTATLTAWVQSASEPVTAAVHGSFLAASARWLVAATRESWLYRWLTTEPDADVVVIDLRDTMTVGPILALLDRVGGPLARHWRHAGLRGVFEGVSGAVLARPVQALSLVVLAAVGANLALLLALGTAPFSGAVGLRLVLAGIALGGTRVRVSAEELADSRAFELVVRLLEPPDPPDVDEEGER